MRIEKRSFAILLLLSALSACTTTGIGTGQTVGAGAQSQPIVFTWASKDNGISGNMTASLSGSTFEGRFFQITQETRGETLTPLWSYWRNGWYDWPYWGGPMPYPATQFITRYSGKVVATLEGAGNQKMRCRFHLVQPATGMSGGGEGECQLSDGRTVQANFASK